MTGASQREHDDRIWGFPAFPALPGRSRGGRGRFARSWWGRAWVQAIEDTALDAEPLRRGRAYARAGLVGPITVSPGRIAASVHSEDQALYQTHVRVAELTDADWDRFLDQVAAKAGHIAALLDRDMPHELADAAEDVGLRLLPGLGDLEPECDCPLWELPCTHAAALCYQTSWLLDADPFVLLLMRGRGRRELLAELQRRNVGQYAEQERASPSSPGSHPAGTPAWLAYTRRVAPLPDPPSMPPPVPATEAAPLAASTPGIDPDALELLVADAAARARELLAAHADLFDG